MLFKKKEKKSSEVDWEEIRNRVKKIKIFTKRLVHSSFSGDYVSAFRGQGFEFDQIRDYQLGDDIRFIDWNNSAKMNKIMVKQLIQERDRTVILVIDTSFSTLFSSKNNLRNNIIENISATLAFIAHESKDRVGAIFFSDKVDYWIPPSRGNVHIGRIIEAIFCQNLKKTKSNINEVLKFLVQLKKKNAIVFMISDWVDNLENYSKILKIVGCEYDFVGIRFVDDCEKYLPDVGLLEIKDLETEENCVIDTRDTKNKNNINIFLSKRLMEQKRVFDKYKIDLLDLHVDRSFINPMINFFRQRIRRQI